MPETPGQKIQRQIAAIRQQGGDDADVAAFLSSHPAVTQVAGESKAGNIDLRVPPVQAESTSVTPARKASKSISDHVYDAATTAEPYIDALVSGVPGAQRAVAGFSNLLSHAGIGNDNTDESLARQREKTASLSAKARIPLQIAGGAPVAALLAPYGLVGGGAAYGAAQGADAPAESFTGRMLNTGKGAAIGAASAKAGQLLGKGVANVVNRAGFTDLVAEGVNKISPKLAATMGTRGQVNAALEDRQDILDALGDNGTTAAASQLKRIANTKAQAKVLYGAARKDTRALSDPELQQLLADPQIQKAYQVASELRSAAGNPLPQVTAPDQVPLALQKMGVSQEQYQKLTTPEMMQSRRIGISGVEVLPPELLGEKAAGIDMPDPDVLAKTKRYLVDAAKGRQDSPLAMRQDEARALLPKIDAIRTKLHDLSPAWKQADAFYAGAKGEEEAFAHGFDAFRLSANPKGAQLATHSPEAMLASIEQTRYPGEPASAQAARAAAFRQGVKSAAAGQVRNAPVERGAVSALGSSAFAPTQHAAQVRGLMNESPEAAQTLEQFLAKARGEVQANGLGTGQVGLPTSRFAMMKAVGKSFLRPPDKLATPKGQSLIAQRLGNPDLLAQELGNTKAGEMLARLLGQTGGISVGGMVSR